MNSRRVVAVLVVASAVLAPLTGVAALGSDEHADRGHAVVAAQEEPTDDPGNETTTVVRHRNPDERNQDGDIEQVQAWLVGQLSGRLGDSTLQLSQGEYEQAKRFLGDDYDEDLEKLVDVAGETDATRAFRQTREDQRDLANATQEYQRTLEEYREARENGNTERARRLGRELGRVASRVNESATGTMQGYEQLNATTGQDFTAERERVGTIAENVSETQAEIERDLFVETELAVTADAEQVSFADPLDIEGTLTTANGTAVAEEAVTIRVGQRRYAVETDADGSFTLEYRPVRLPVSAASVAVVYEASLESRYANASASLPVDVEGVTPTVSVERAPAEVGFGEDLSVTGQVGADDTGVPGVPVVVTVGGERVAATRTGPDGEYAVTRSLPAGVAVGDQLVRVRVAQQGRAIAQAAGQASVAVVETGTDLSLTAEAAGAETVRVSGQLRTVDGEPVPGQSVALAVNGTAVTTVTTDSEGRYAATVAVPSSVDGEAVVVNATYAGAGTNLRPSRASDQVTLAGAAGGGGVREQVSENALLVAAVAAALVVLAAVVLVLLLRGDDLPWLGGEQSDAVSASEGGPDEEAVGAAPAGTEAEAEAGTAAEGASPVGAAALLSRAQERLAAGDANEGAVTAYAAVRRALGAAVPGSRSLTHWEFYHRLDEELSKDERESLHYVTTGYERAAFALSGVSAQVAESVVDTASRFTDDGEEDG